MICEEPTPERAPPALNRAASVREPSSTNSHPHTAAPGTIGQRHHAHEFVPQTTQPKAPVDAKRRTVQVEYVEPRSQTKRGSAVDPDQQGPIDNREAEEADTAAPAPVVPTSKHHENLARAATTAGTVSRHARTASTDQQKGKEREVLQVAESKNSSRNRPASYAYQSAATPRVPGSGDGTVSKPPSRRPSRDRNGPPVSGKVFTAAEPGTTSTRPNTANSLGGSNRMPSRGGSHPRPVAPSVAANNNNAQGKIAMPKSGKPYTISNPIPQPDNSEAIGSSEMGKPSTAVLPAKYTTRPSTQPEQPVKGHKRANTVGGGAGGEAGRFLGKFMGGSDKQDNSMRPTMTAPGEPRQSLDQSGRSKYEKSSGSKSRRFSLLPTSFSLRSMSNAGHARRPSRSTSGLSGGRQYTAPDSQPQTSSQPQLGVPNAGGGESVLTGSDTSLAVESAPASAAGGGFGRDSIDIGGSNIGRRPTVLQKNRKFTEGEVSGTGGSSGPARRVMDFFRRRGVVRSKGDA